MKKNRNTFETVLNVALFKEHRYFDKALDALKECDFTRYDYYKRLENVAIRIRDNAFTMMYGEWDI